MRLELDIQRVWKDNFRVYGARKVWRQLLREGIGVALLYGRAVNEEAWNTRCSTRQKVLDGPFRTICFDRPTDKVNRQFSSCPAQSIGWRYYICSDMDRICLCGFITDVFARYIVGWRVSRSLRTELILDALEQALWARRGTSGLIHITVIESRFHMMCGSLDIDLRLPA